MSQQLILPFKLTRIEAGALHPKYAANWGYQHYGWDLSGKVRKTEEDVYASGYGKVIKCGKDNKFGYVAVIQYYDVMNHATEKHQDIIARYLHMRYLYVKDEQEITPKDRIGIMSGYGKTPTSYGIHLHVEFDKSVSTPMNSGQCSSSNIIKNGKIANLINPNEIFYIGEGQTLTTFNGAWCYPEDVQMPKGKAATTKPTSTTKVESSTIATSNYQKLILPVNNAKVTAGFKNDQYRKKYGYIHYGHDIISTKQDNLTIYACGKGTVKAAGKDKVLGNVVVIQYNQVYNENTKKAQNVIVRCYHMQSVNVKAGQAVTKDTKIGVMGNLGKLCDGVHLHLEIDSDIYYPCYSPTLGTSSNIIKKGTDTVINPAYILHVKTTKPDSQTIDYAADNYVSESDKLYKLI